MRGKRLTHSTHNPRRVRGCKAHPFSIVLQLGFNELKPLIGGALTHPAKHGVNEPGWARADSLTRQRNTLIQGRVGGHPHLKQLVCAHPQNNEGGGVYLMEGPVGAAR